MNGEVPLPPTEEHLARLLAMDMRKWPWQPSDRVLLARARIIVVSLRNHADAVRAVLAADTPERT